MTYCTFFESEGAHGIEEKIYKDAYRREKRKNDEYDKKKC